MADENNRSERRGLRRPAATRGRVPPHPQRSVGFVAQCPQRAGGGRGADRRVHPQQLAWIAAHHASEFSEFILSLSSGRRYLSMTREEIIETCRHNQARQIPGTHYWAIMNIDSATKRRFLARVLEYIGYRDTVIVFVCDLFGARVAPRRNRFGILVT
jgi:hypothetical protein